MGLITDTFAPVTKSVTMTLALAFAAIQEWHLHQLDVNEVFLHGDLHEEVFMTITQACSPKGEIPVNAICKLQKSLYGVEQASRQWFEKFSSALIDEGFSHSAIDYSLFMKHFGNRFIVLLVYVDYVIMV